MLQFAVFYVVAQAIERIIELVSIIFRVEHAKPDANLVGRKVIIWAVASAMGFAAAWVLGLGFLKTAGYQIDPWADRILSGILLGSGTKPIHDIISYIQKGNTTRNNEIKGWARNQSRAMGGNEESKR